MRSLLESSFVKPHTENELKQTPLEYATLQGVPSLEILRLLVPVTRKGVHARNHMWYRRNYTPFFQTWKHGSIEEFRFMLDNIDPHSSIEETGEHSMFHYMSNRLMT